MIVHELQYSIDCRRLDSLWLLMSLMSLLSMTDSDTIQIIVICFCKISSLVVTNIRVFITIKTSVIFLASFNGRRRVHLYYPSISLQPDWWLTFKSIANGILHETIDSLLYIQYNICTGWHSTNWNYQFTIQIIVMPLDYLSMIFSKLCNFRIWPMLILTWWIYFIYNLKP